MFCNQCGKFIPDGTKFCEYCGCAVPTVSSVQNVFAQQGNVPVNSTNPTHFANQTNPTGFTNPTAPTNPTINGAVPPQGTPVQNNFNAQSQPSAIPPIGSEDTVVLNSPPPGVFGGSQPFTPPPSGTQFGGVQPSFTQQQPPMGGFSEPFAQPSAPQPMTYNSMGADPNANGGMPSFSAIPNPAAPQAAVKEKNNKALKLILIIVPLLIVLGVATFFVIKFITRNAETQYMKENPSAYLFNSYGSTLKGPLQNDEIFSVIASESKQQTVKVNFNIQNVNGGFTYALDADAGKSYMAYDMSDAFKAAIAVNSNQTVLKVDAGSKSYDYFINNDASLRENAKKSVFGPQGKNLLNVDEEQFNKALDVYEATVKALSSSESNDQYKIKELAEKLGKTLDTCGNVAITEETVTIDNQSVNADVITHTFTDFSVVSQVCNDVKEWKATANLDSDTSQAIDEQLASMEKQVALLSGKQFNFTIKHYLNKDNHTIMLLDVSFTYEEQSMTMKVTFGADPTTSDKITMTAAVTGSSTGSNGEFTLELKRSNDASSNTYELNLVSGVNNANLTLKREKSNGDFTLTGTSNGQSLFTVTGNIQISSDSVNIKINNIDGKGSTMEFYVSSKYEGTDLTSTNDLLAITEEELMKVGTELSSELSSLGGTSGLGGYGGYDYDYDYDYDDYSYEDYYDYNDLTTSTTQGLTLSYQKAA